MKMENVSNVLIIASAFLKEIATHAWMVIILMKLELIASNV